MKAVFMKISLFCCHQICSEFYTASPWYLEPGDQKQNVKRGFQSFSFGRGGLFIQPVILICNQLGVAVKTRYYCSHSRCQWPSYILNRSYSAYSAFCFFLFITLKFFCIAFDEWHCASGQTTALWFIIRTRFSAQLASSLSVLTLFSLEIFHFYFGPSAYSHKFKKMAWGIWRDAWIEKAVKETQEQLRQAMEG